MVLMNYHAMTMNEPRDSPARRQQFLVICSVMAAAFAYTALTSGIFLSVTATEGPFPGGNYCYKFVIRDYAASMGQARRIADDWAWATLDVQEKGDMQKLEKEEKAQYKKLKKGLDSKLYHIYFDDTMKMGGTRQRYTTGVLVSDADKAEYCDPLLSKNEAIEQLARKNARIPLDEKSAGDIFDETPYEIVDLPSVDSLVVQFPFTSGFVSSLIFSYKVRFPAVRATNSNPHKNTFLIPWSLIFSLTPGLLIYRSFRRCEKWLSKRVEPTQFPLSFLNATRISKCAPIMLLWYRPRTF
jgi:hypothetical protein